MKDITCNAEYQHMVGDFVSREVVQCVSFLVSELSKQAEHFPEWEDELWALQRKDQYNHTIYYACDCGEEWEETEECSDSPEPEEEDATCPKCGSDCCSHDADTEETDSVEVYEHWIVSDWLARKLEEHGEIVCHDLMGLTIWGRCTTEQAIKLDYVICQIFNELCPEKVAALRAECEDKNNQSHGHVRKLPTVQKEGES